MAAALSDMAGDLSSELLNFGISDSEDSSSTSPAAETTQSREDKTAQSEAAFQAVKAAYRPKLENGEVGSLAPSRGRSREG